jgi:hypothetical protein
MYYHSRTIDSDLKGKSSPKSATKQFDVTVEEVLLWEAT